MARLMKMRTRRGVLVEEMGQTYLADFDDGAEEARTLRPRLHLIRFHGVLAPYARLRPLVVETVQAQPQRISRARLLEWVFDIDMHTCPNCGSGEQKIIAAILERPVIEKILTHLGLDPQRQNRAPPAGARAPAHRRPRPQPAARRRRSARPA